MLGLVQVTGASLLVLSQLLAQRDRAVSLHTLEGTLWHPCTGRDRLTAPYWSGLRQTPISWPFSSTSAAVKIFFFLCR